MFDEDQEFTAKRQFKLAQQFYLNHEAEKPNKYFSARSCCHCTDGNKASNKGSIIAKTLGWLPSKLSHAQNSLRNERITLHISYSKHRLRGHS